MLFHYVNNAQCKGVVCNTNDTDTIRSVVFKPFQRNMIHTQDITDTLWL